MEKKSDISRGRKVCLGIICLIILVVIAACVALVVYWVVGLRPPDPITYFRLPRSLYPVSYDIEIKPDMYPAEDAYFHFEGQVKILMNCTNDTTNITLHMDNLKLENKSISLVQIVPTRKPLKIGHYSVDIERDFLILYPNDVLHAGSQYSLTLNFSGPRYISMNPFYGLYLDTYQRGNESVPSMVSQLQPTFARSVFPCFDEPDLKATFNVVIVRKPPFVSLSTMPVKETQNRSDGYVADVFHTTETMSTYLLAFIVCDFAYKESVTTGGTVVRIWAAPEDLDNADLALGIGVKALQFYEGYFRVKYPLPKLDMVAAVSMVSYGMENWGLIIYMGRIVLHDPKTSTPEQKELTAALISHEIVHMWFGDIVTPAWWDGIWLSEGFARYLQNSAMDFLFPDWNIFDQFVWNPMTGAMTTDSLVTSHTMSQNVQHPEDILKNFDEISYSKGACIVRMMEYVLGESTFKAGLTTYLRRRSYKAARPEHLYKAWQKQLKAEGRQLNVKNFMEPWTHQINYPVVTIKRIGYSKIELRQDRFVTGKNDSEEADDSPFGYSWEIPFTYTTSSERDFNHHRIDYMPRGEQTVTIQVDPLPENGSSWIIGNIQYYGYYLVNYDAANWDAIIRQLKLDHTVIAVKNRAQIIKDSYSLAETSLVDTDVPLRVMEYLEHEMGYVPWRIAIEQLSALDKRLFQRRAYGDFRKFIARVITPVYRRLAFGNHVTSHEDLKLQSHVVKMACSYDVTDCVDWAKSLYADWMTDNITRPVPDWVESIVNCTAIRHGAVEEFDFAYRVYRDIHKEEILKAMACSKDTWNLQRFLDPSEDEGDVETYTWMKDISENPVGRHLAWRFMRQNWGVVTKRMGSYGLSRTITHVLKGFNTELDYIQIENYVKTHEMGGMAKRSFKDILKVVRSNINWLEKNEKIISDWLEKYLDS